MDLKKNFEAIVILFSIVALLFLYGRLPFSERLMIVGLSTLSLYYLLSGALVLFNSRIWRIMRLIYFVGLWSISIGLLGVIFKLSFWQNSRILLLVSFSSGMAVLIFIFSYYRTIKPEAKTIAADQLKPVLYRLAVYPLLFLLLFNVSSRSLYTYMGAHREDQQYIDLLMDTLDNPDDQKAAKALEDYKKEMEER